MMTLDAFKAARKVLDGVLHSTDLMYSPFFSKMTGNNVYIKPENMQVTGAYKIRGAYFKCSTLSEEEKTEVRMLHEYLSQDGYTLDDLNTNLYAIPAKVWGLEPGTKELKAAQGQFFKTVSVRCDGMTLEQAEKEGRHVVRSR